MGSLIGSESQVSIEKVIRFLEEPGLTLMSRGLVGELVVSISLRGDVD